MYILTHMNDFGRLIKKTRKKQGLTQEQLAATCGVGVRFIRELEKGKESCHMGKALLVLSMLGINLQVYEDNL
jgi:y4mF family transcriptional regulator